MLREKLFLDYASDFVEGVNRAVHTNVYINGEYWGLYTAVEQIDKTFVQSRFGSDEDGNLYKGAASDDTGNDPMADFGSDLTWLGLRRLAVRRLLPTEDQRDRVRLLAVGRIHRRSE